MTEYNDALIYASIKNILTPETMNKLNINIKPLVTDKDTEQTFYNNLLNYSSIKRACCLYNTPNTTADKFNIPVRVPLSKTVDPENLNITNADLYKKYKFIDKIIAVPKKLCSNPRLNYTNQEALVFTNGSNQCDDFMNVYCKNISANFKNTYNYPENSPRYFVDFPEYKPECSCYADVPASVAALGVSRTCTNLGCEKTSLSVYHNPFSPCASTICQNIVNVNDNTARDISLMPKMSNQCGIGQTSASATTTTATPKPATTTTTTTTPKPASTETPAPAPATVTPAPAPAPATETTAPAPATTTVPATTSSSPISKTAIAILAVIGIIILVCIFGLIWYITKKSRKPKYSNNEYSEYYDD